MSRDASVTGGSAAYGALGRIGVGTPQANPTVEAEMAILLPRTCSLHVTRLTSPHAESAARLKDYLVRLENYLLAYDTFRPDVFGFACTGSSYLLGAREEDRLVARARVRFGYPIETTPRAIAWSLDRMGAQRIALMAPYPSELMDAALRYWITAGLRVVRSHPIATRTADTRGIYDLTARELSLALHEVPLDGIDAVLVSGTGLPSLPAMLDQAGSVPIISSNMCLAARLIDLLGHSDRLDARLPHIRGWEGRLSEALAHP